MSCLHNYIQCVLCKIIKINLIIKHITIYNNHVEHLNSETNYYLFILQGLGEIKERNSGEEVLRLSVSDSDSKGSSAWRAKFTIHGDPENYFQIHTDPKSNDGILTIIKVFLCF